MSNSNISVCDDIRWIHLVVVVNNVDGVSTKLPLDAVVRDCQSSLLLWLHWRSNCVGLLVRYVPQGHLDNKHLAEAVFVHMSIPVRQNRILGKIDALAICSPLTPDDIKPSCPTNYAHGIIVSGAMKHKLLIAVAHLLSQQFTSRSVLPP